MKRRPPTPPRPIAPPAGWSVEADRREEWLALSEIVADRMARR